MGELEQSTRPAKVELKSFKFLKMRTGPVISTPLPSTGPGPAEVFAHEQFAEGTKCGGRVVSVHIQVRSLALPLTLGAYGPSPAGTAWPLLTIFLQVLCQREVSTCPPVRSSASTS